MNLSSLTDDELHRIARDSTDPLVLELMRRMDRNGDDLRALEDDLRALEDELEELQTNAFPITNN